MKSGMRELLESSENRVLELERKGRVAEGEGEKKSNEEEEISWEKIESVIKKIEKGKAARKDALRNEV